LTSRATVGIVQERRVKTRRTASAAYERKQCKEALRKRRSAVLLCPRRVRFGLNGSVSSVRFSEMVFRASQFSRSCRYVSEGMLLLLAPTIKTSAVFVDSRPRDVTLSWRKAAVNESMLTARRTGGGGVSAAAHSRRKRKNFAQLQTALRASGSGALTSGVQSTERGLC
jgi:hypothetical protein